MGFHSYSRSNDHSESIFFLHKKYIAGIASNSMMTDVITPPTIGAAMRFITSEPVPWLHMIGSKPAIITDAVMIFGRTRFTAPWSIAASLSVPW